ncbi:hypothetical protein FSARC_2640 [Fusarium sarcochroum]|uniref:Heterokaryon incompatibility domain-containing protein n=1 Tax=Fusarium sarcochroum TaxID=1208366 RepID=A0A8H4U5P5_9HYPO|nr:hypothetical protein FSARC_2640 [Fusarium sarcochroum]
MKDDACRIELTPTDSPQSYQYVALSHEWRDLKPELALKSNLEDRMNGIPVQDLPSTFRDAVVTANNLGYHYLWIDSLWIVQDDDKDRERECLRMSSICQGAALTIAAPAAKDPPVGFLHKRPLHDNPDYQPCTLQYRNSAGQPINTIKI